MYAFIVKRPNKGEIIPKKDDILPEITFLYPSLARLPTKTAVPVN